VLVGSTGGTTFTDDTLTQGTPGATYIISGQRGQVTGAASKRFECSLEWVVAARV